MTTETVLTDEQIQWIGSGARLSEYGGALAFARAIEQAVLQSPEVQQMRKDAERYQFCRSQSSPAEIHIHGVEMGLAGDSLDEAMDSEMREWKSIEGDAAMEKKE